MLKKECINIKILYYVNDKVFNVGENGSKIGVDPITNKQYTYGSADNVKHQLKESVVRGYGHGAPILRFSKKMNLKGTSTSKEVTESESKEQGGVSVETDFSKKNMLINTTFGAWNSEISQDDNKYKKMAFTSSFTVSNFRPFDARLISTRQGECGVCVGGSNSKVVPEISDSKTGGKLYVSIEELKERLQEKGISEDNVREIEEAMRSKRAMNFYKKNTTSSGVYVLDITINAQTFGMISKSNFGNEYDRFFDEARKNGWKDLGDLYGDYDHYMAMDKYEVLKVFGLLVDSIINFRFSSNESTHGSLIEPLRYTVSRNANHLTYCTTLSVNEVDGKERVKLLCNDNLYPNGDVWAFNTESLKKFNVESGKGEIAYDPRADEDFKKAVMDMGNAMIDEAYDVPFGGVQRKKIYSPKNKVDMRPTMKRHDGKGGSISIPKNKA